MKLAKGYEQLEKFDKAFLNLEKALSLDPGNPDVINDLARIKSMQGRRERMEHLGPRLQPKSFEENNEEI